MLSADLVRARRRGDRLELIALRPEDLRRAQALAESILEAFQASLGKTRRELDEALDQVPHAAREQKTFRALTKLAEDHAEFESQPPLDPPTVRDAVFRRSAAAWQRGETSAEARARVLEDAALALGSTPEAVERALFSDLRSEERLVRAPELSAARLTESWPHAEAQAVLLRAVRLSVTFGAQHVGAARAFFRKLKFHRLLFQIHPTQPGSAEYRVEIDGPASLFESSTRYGLELALVVPALEDLGAYTLEAELRWGKERTPLGFTLRGQGGARAPGDAPPRAPRDAPPRAPRDAPALPDEHQKLIEGIASAGRGWRAEPAETLIDLPGFGLVVPDLRLVHQDGRVAFVEVLGHWSRDAVIRRVELVERGLGAPLVFAASSRLRVSEALLPEDAPACLYVYKGVMRAAAVLERAERVARV